MNQTIECSDITTVTYTKQLITSLFIILYYHVEHIEGAKMHVDS